MKKFYLKLLLILVCIVFLIQQMNAQVTTNSGSGLAATYTSLANAITALNAATISSPVVITLTGNETAPAGGYSITQLGGTATNTITIQGSSSTITAYTPQVTGQRYDAIFKIIGGDYITLQNFTIQENSGNTVATLASNTMTEFGVALFASSTTNGAQNNTIQNNTITLSSATKYQNAIGIFSTCASSSTNGVQAASNIAGTNSNNKYYGNTISGVATGIYFIAPAQTATVFESGNDIGGSSLSTANNITFGASNTAGDLGFTSYSGATAAGVYFRNVVGNSVKYNTINAVSTLTLPCGGIFSATGTAPTGITYTSNFSNNNITLYNVGTTSITGIDFGSGLATGTIICNENTITLNQNCTAASSAAVTAIKAAYLSATNTCNTNNITINQSETTGVLSSATIGIDMSGAGSTLNALANTILVNQTTSSSSAVTTAITGIKTATASTIVNIGSSGNANTITIKQAVTGSGSYGSGAVTFIESGGLVNHGTVNVLYNNLNTTGSSLRTTGTTIGINNNGTIPTALNINNNTINIDRSGATATTGDFYGIWAGSGATSGASTYSISTNSITLNSISYGTTYGLFSNDGNTNKIINSNTINVSGSAKTLYGMYFDRGTNNIGASGLGNTITLASSVLTPTIYGIQTAVNGASTFNIKYNTFSSISATSASTSAPIISVIKINTGTSNSPTTDISFNTITGVTTGAGSGSATINGIDIASGTTNSGTNNIYKNKIYDLSTACTGTSSIINGILITRGTTNNIYNNLIGLSGSLTGVNSAEAYRGISITSSVSSSTHNVYYNTVYINSSSTSTNFGTTGIYHATSGTATTSALNLRNNIIVNVSTPSGTGKTLAYKRSSSTLTNYASTSNNNIFYAGTPGANNMLMYDGTNSYQTLSSYKTAVGPTRDVNSYTENPTWLSTTGADANFLHLNTGVATQAESGAVNISTYTDDFDGVTRQGNTGYAGSGTAPDIGADEGEFISLDATAPSISYTTLSNSSSTSGQTLSSVTISDPSPGLGINTTSGTKPRIYFKRSTDDNTYVDNTNTSNGWKYVETTSGSSPFSFTIDFSLIYNSVSDAISAGDFIQYFVVAQDLASTPNVGIYNGAFNTSPSSVALTSGVFPITGTISQYEVLPSGGNYTIGTGGQPTYNYATLTGASGFFAAMNNANTQISSNINLTIAADLTEDGTNTLNQWTGSNTLTIQPSGVRTVSGSVAGNMITLNGADRVTIDGLNTGGNSLTFSNTSTSGISTIKLVNDATYNNISNCTILGSTTATLASDGGVVWISTGTSTGNDNNTISYCKIGPAGANLPSKGIFAYGTNSSSAICNSNVTIDHCEIYDFFLTGGCAGFYAYENGSGTGSGNTDWTISNNTIYQTASRTMTGTMSGIYFRSSTYGNNIQITGNTIGYSSNSGTGALTITGSGNFNGILSQTQAAAATTCNINSNIVSDISFTSSTGTLYGIYNYNSSATSNTININSNQVKNITNTTTTGNIAAIYAGMASTLNCNSNIIDNISRSGAGAFYGIQYTNPTTITIDGNTIKNLSSTSTSSTSAFYCIYSGSSAATENITGNSIYNISTSSTGAQTVMGIVNSAGSGAKNIQNNNVYSISAAAGSATLIGIKLGTGSASEISGNKVYTLSGGQTLYGIQIAGGSTVNTFKNKIYDITSANTSPVVYGLYLSGGTTNNVYNNLIGDLKTTAANTAIPLAGIYINTSTANIYYNTVYLNATSSGTNFGSTAIYASTTPTIDFRNNIFVNNSTPKGTGFASAYRRSGTTLTTYATTSNNNLFYAGTPGANNLIFYDGTNSDQTLATFKTRMSTRDQASISENPTWMSTTGSDATFLHINTSTATVINGGGSGISSYTSDYDGDTRLASGVTDIGADEFEPTYAWTGNTDNNWNTTGNWSWNIVPASSNDVIISDVTNDPMVNENPVSPAVCRNLTINSGVLTIASGKALTVNGTLTNNAGNIGLLIKSDATGTGSLITSSIVNGTVERYIAKDNSWHFLSSPVAAQVIKPNFAPTVADATFDFFKWDESDASYIAPWINIRNTNGTYATGFDNFETGKGYLVAYSSSYTGNATHEFTGNLNSGDQSISISNSGNTFNLIGNPFASAIDWNATGYANRDDIILKNTTPSIFVWNSTDGNYGVYNSTIGTGTHSVSNIIAPHQGFFVEAKATGSFTVPNSARIHPGAQNFLKSTPSNLLRLKVNSNMNTYSDEVIVNFNSNATANDGVSKWYSMLSTAPSLFTVKNSKNLSINTLPAISNNLIIPLSFIAGVNGNYSITASELNSFAANTYIYLKDLKTNIVKDLNQNSTYSFTGITTDNSSRFELIFALSPLSINNLTVNNNNIYSYNNIVYINSNEKVKQVMVYNMLGQIVKAINEQNITSVDLNTMPTAYYIVKVITENNVYSEKVLVK